MPDIPFNRLEEFAPLGEEDRTRLRTLCGPVMRLGPNQRIHSQGQSITRIYLLARGWVTSAVEFPDGARQIIKVHLPGDLLGVPSIALEGAAETLTAVTDVELRPIRISDFCRLVIASPRIGALMFMVSQQERVMLMDRLASIGRCRSVNRVAALLVHLYDRLCVIDPEQPPRLDLPLTQLELAEMLGITPVHMNRTLRELEETGLVARRRNKFELLDIPNLRRLAALSEHRWRKRPEWIAEEGT